MLTVAVFICLLIYVLASNTIDIDNQIPLAFITIVGLVLLTALEVGIIVKAVEFLPKWSSNHRKLLTENNNKEPQTKVYLILQCYLILNITLIMLVIMIIIFIIWNIFSIKPAWNPELLLRPCRAGIHDLSTWNKCQLVEFLVRIVHMNIFDLIPWPSHDERLFWSTWQLDSGSYFLGIWPEVCYLMNQ